MVAVSWPQRVLCILLRKLQKQKGEEYPLHVGRDLNQWCRLSSSPQSRKQRTEASNWLDDRVVKLSHWNFGSFQRIKMRWCSIIINSSLLLVYHSRNDSAFSLWFCGSMEVFNETLPFSTNISSLDAVHKVWSRRSDCSMARFYRCSTGGIIQLSHYVFTTLQWFWMSCRRNLMNFRSHHVIEPSCPKLWPINVYFIH